MQPVSLIIVGADSRGSRFAQFALDHPELAKVVGMAAPRPFYRQRVADQHAVAPEHVAEDWRELVTRRLECAYEPECPYSALASIRPACAKADMAGP